MEFSLSTLGFSQSSVMVGMFSPTKGSNKRRQFAPPLVDTLPKLPVATSEASASETSTGLLPHRDSFILQYLKQAAAFTASSSDSTRHRRRKIVYDDFDSDNDDDTASTVSMTSSGDDTDSLEESSRGSNATQNNKKSVRFSSTLVTHVHTRPRTTPEDKYYLHYNEHEYMDFKIGYVTGKDRTRKVGFARDVVSEVEYIQLPCPATRAKLYYSEDELQCFLDEFVQSLNSS